MFIILMVLNDSDMINSPLCPLANTPCFVSYGLEFEDERQKRDGFRILLLRPKKQKQYVGTISKAM